MDKDKDKGRGDTVGWGRLGQGGANAHTTLWNYT